MGKLVLSLLFLIIISFNAFAEEHKIFTNKDLEKYQNKPKPPQEISSESEQIEPSAQYIKRIWGKIDKTCGYEAIHKKTKDGLLRSLEECNSLFREVNGDQNIPSNTRVLMLNEITIGIEQINKFLNR